MNLNIPRRPVRARYHRARPSRPALEPLESRTLLATLNASSTYRTLHFDLASNRLRGTISTEFPPAGRPPGEITQTRGTLSFGMTGRVAYSSASEGVGSFIVSGTGDEVIHTLNPDTGEVFHLD